MKNQIWKELENFIITQMINRPKKEYEPYKIVLGKMKELEEKESLLRNPYRDYKG